jgi:hypothetical protein
MFQKADRSEVLLVKGRVVGEGDELRALSRQFRRSQKATKVLPTCFKTDNINLPKRNFSETLRTPERATYIDAQSEERSLNYHRSERIRGQTRKPGSIWRRGSSVLIYLKGN